MGKIKLSELATTAPGEFDKADIKKELKDLLKELDDLQYVLYAEHKHSILVLLQGMDASGKDGLIRDVFTTMNPQGISVTSFKVPNEEELSHDFLWRIHRHTPPKGMIHIFNRSHYEDVLVTRAHGLIDDDQARKRMAAINDFERMLEENNNTHILKFYLHVSADEQKARLDERLTNPQKMWKYNKDDNRDVKLRTEFTAYYEDVFQQCDTPAWHIVPADQNWYKAYVVAKTLRDVLKGLNLKYPERK